MRTLILTLAAIALAPIAAQADCAASKSWTVAFTAPGAKDVMTVDTLGPACEGAVTVLVVRDAGGQPAFVDVWPFAWFADNNGALPAPGAALDRLYAGGAMKASALPEEPENERQWLEAPPEVYARARGQGGPLLCYTVAHEGGRCAWFDAEFGSGVLLVGNGS